jgi:hypothetical protein
LPTKRKIPAKTLKLINETLGAIIDQWYLSVCDYYVTAEKKAQNASIELPEELKRFHDESGHRIKFNKGDLDFTYGLALLSPVEGCVLEVSVNNKVRNFDYGELVRRLAAHYRLEKAKPLERLKKAKKVPQGEVFVLPEDIQACVTVEQRDGKADIVRLAFGLEEQYLEDLAADPPTFMDVIHQYCVAPLRRIYAEVFRTKRR